MYGFLGCEKAKTLAPKRCEKANTLAQKGSEKQKKIRLNRGVKRQKLFQKLSVSWCIDLSKILFSTPRISESISFLFYSSPPLLSRAQARRASLARRASPPSPATATTRARPAGQRPSTSWTPPPWRTPTTSATTCRRVREKKTRAKIVQNRTKTITCLSVCFFNPQSRYDALLRLGMPVVSIGSSLPMSCYLDADSFLGFCLSHTLLGHQQITY